MIGDMIAKVRKEKGITKTELAKLTKINIGHLTHIEKGERNPSHKALKNICKALDIPYQQLMYTYDKSLNEEQEQYNLIEHISYNKVLAVNNISNFIDCPASIPSSSIAIRIQDDSMAPLLQKNAYAFIEFNSLLDNKEIGLFQFNDKILFRKFYLKNGKIILKAQNKEYEDIIIDDEDNFFIIGKVLFEKKLK